MAPAAGDLLTTEDLIAGGATEGSGRCDRGSHLVGGGRRSSTPLATHPVTAARRARRFGFDDDADGSRRSRAFGIAERGTRPARRRRAGRGGRIGLSRTYDVLARDAGRPPADAVVVATFDDGASRRTDSAA
jgi:hypothetical protein